MSLATSPFSDRLNTNYVPSDAEVVELRAILVDPVDELARLDAQIQEMEFALSELRERHASLKAPIDSHRALMSPIRRISRDVLLEIFFSCLPEHNALIDPTEVPMLLGHICRHWRSVAYSTPSLWSSIHIPSTRSPFFPNIVPPSVHFILGGIVAEWLERSASCSLSVSLAALYLNSAFETHPLVSPLVAVSRRLRHLAVSGDVPSLLPLLRLGEEDLPSLQSIRIQSSTHLRFDDHPDAMNVLQIPTLRDITLSVVIDPLSIPLRWSQLTRLSLICQSLWTDSGSLGGLDVNRGLEILRRSPNLVSCHITAHERSEPSAVNISAITLPHLESLILGGRFFLPDHISCLVLPKLRYLQIGDVSEKPFGDDSPHDSSLRAYVDPNCLSTGKLVELFRHFPMISYLTLSTAQSYRYTNVLLDEPFLALFCASYDILCPMLTHMAVMSPSAGFSDIAALALVKARMAMPCPLQQFRVHFGRSMEVDIMPELQSWISDGLQVDLQYYVPPQWEFNSREGLSAPEPSWF